MPEGIDSCGAKPLISGRRNLRCRFLERWCAPSTKVMQSPVTVNMAMDPAAANYGPPGADISLIIIDINRCRLAPLWPLQYWSAPAAGMSRTWAAPSLSVSCTVDTPKARSKQSGEPAGWVMLGWDPA